jgi:hypothetical protein
LGVLVGPPRSGQSWRGSIVSGKSDPAIPAFLIVSDGVDELDRAKLTPLLRLKYRDSIADAVKDLGKPEEIGAIFSGFQRHLYAAKATST